MLCALSHTSLLCRFTKMLEKLRAELKAESKGREETLRAELKAESEGREEKLKAEFEDREEKFKAELKAELGELRAAVAKLEGMVRTVSGWWVHVNGQGGEWVMDAREWSGRCGWQMHVNCRDGEWVAGAREWRGGTINSDRSLF